MSIDVNSRPALDDDHLRGLLRDVTAKLSAKRAAVIERELVAKGISKSEIESVGMGSEKMLVKPDDTPQKKAKNRRYEIQVRL